MAAIYMWFEGHEIVVTTTPYPVEVVESLVFGVSVETGSMVLVPFVEFEAEADFVSGTHFQARWFYTDGPYDDDFYSEANFISGTYIQTRWFYVDGPYDDDFYGEADLISMAIINKLVEADSPDEALQLTCLVNTGSSMTLI